VLAADTVGFVRGPALEAIDLIRGLAVPRTHRESDENENPERQLPDWSERQKDRQYVRDDREYRDSDNHIQYLFRHFAREFSFMWLNHK